MVKTVIFDIGGVLVGYDWDKYLMNLFNDRPKVDKIKDALFGHGIWDEVDRGVWTVEELMNGFFQNGQGLEKEIRIFWENAGEALWQYDFTKELIQKLKNCGVQVLFLSNWSDHMRTVASKQLDFLPMMDGGVFSYQEKLIKPDHKIYERIVEKYNLVPNQCVFLDDNEKNVGAARECGLNAIHVVDHDRAHEELFRMLEI